MHVHQRLGAPVLIDARAELLAVPLRAARVAVDDDVALRGEVLELVEPADAVRPGGATVDFEEERVLDRRVEAGRLDDPALNLLARTVTGRQPELLATTDINLCDLGVQRRQRASIAATAHLAEEFAGTGGGGCAVRRARSRPANIPPGDGVRALGDLRRCAAARRDAPDLRRAVDRREEVQIVADPRGPVPVVRAGVGHHAGADRAVEVGHLLRRAARRGRCPEPVVRAAFRGVGVPDEGERRTIRRPDGAAVRTVMRRHLGQRAGGDIDGPDIRAAVVILVLAAIGHEGDLRAVRRPGDLPDAHRPGGQLPRLSAGGGDDE